MARAIKPRYAPPDPPPKKQSGGVIGLLVVFVIGWFAGRLSAPEPSPPPEAAAIEAPVAAPQRVSAPAASPSPPEKPLIAEDEKRLADLSALPPPSGAPEQVAASTGTLSDDIAAALERPATLAYVTTSALNIRGGPGAEFPVAGRLGFGDQVSVIERSGSWVRVSADAATGWVSARSLSETKPQPVVQIITDAQIRDRLIQQSRANYSGSCPCPYNVDRGGRACGGRSAYSRPGGASPLCYPSDVSDAEVRAYRQRLNP